MGKRVYRLCLIVVLCAAVAAGVFYYYNILDRQRNSPQGTLVYEMSQEQKA